MNVVVLLVDPKEKILHCEENPEATLKTISPRLDPGRIATEVLPRPTKGPMTQAENRSMYESLGSAHADVAIENDCRPTSGTAFVRNLVRAAWEEAIYRTKFEIDRPLRRPISVWILQRRRADIHREQPQRAELSRLDPNANRSAVVARTT